MVHKHLLVRYVPNLLFQFNKSLHLEQIFINNMASQCYIQISQGLRTLELCVDNLQPDFLYDHIQPVRAELMQVGIL